MIPKIVHFTFGMTKEWDSKPFHLVHKIAVQSAHDVIKPDKMFMYCNYEPNNEYWNDIRKYVEIVHIDAPTHIFGNLLELSAHKSDVLRLTKLNEIGGIYLDIDTICLNSFDDLLNNKFVMGRQDFHGLCNAIMLAEKNSEFGRLWMDEYKTFYMPQWETHSVRVPHRLYLDNPSIITVLEKNAFFNPDFKNLDDIFVKFVSEPSKYAMHLWESQSWKKFIENIDYNWIKTSDSTYANYARKYLV